MGADPLTLTYPARSKTRTSLTPNVFHSLHVKIIHLTKGVNGNKVTA